MTAPYFSHRWDPAVPADPEAFAKHQRMVGPLYGLADALGPEFDGVLADLKAKIEFDKWGALVTWDCDSTRLRPIELEEINQVVAGGMHLATVDGVFDLSTSDGRFGALCAVARDYCFSGRDDADYFETYGQKRGEPLGRVAAK